MTDNNDRPEPRVSKMAQVRQRKMAIIEATKNGNDMQMNPSERSMYDVMLQLFYKHKKELGKIKSIERKIDRKRELLPEYDAYIDGILQADAGGENQVVSNVLVWRIDVGDFLGALELARYVMKHDLSAPDRFERDMIDVIVEQSAEHVLNSGGPGDVAMLYEVMDLAEGRDVLDQVMLKLHKALGISLEESDKREALKHLERAHELGLKCKTQAGVTKRIDAINRELKKAGADAPDS